VPLQGIFDDLFIDGECISAADAILAIEPRMTEAGLGRWTARVPPGADVAECVGATANTEAEEIVLLAAVPPVVQAELAALADQLLSECHDGDEASDILRSSLGIAGVEGEDWELVRTGSIYGPSDRIEEIRDHVESGCAIYAGSGWSANGLLRFFVGAR